MKYDLIVIGCGVSSYGFLKGLEINNNFKDKNIAIICPSSFTANTQQIATKNISPKFLQKYNNLSLSYYLKTFGNFVSNGFRILGIHGFGGMAKIWGASVATFDDKTLLKNNMNPEEYKNNLNKVLKFIPIKGGNDILNKYFKFSPSSSLPISSRIYKLFKHNNNEFKVGYPRAAIKDSCTNCNQCLIGCINNSIWYPQEQDFLSIRNINLTIIQNRIAYKITNNEVYCYNDNGNSIKYYAKKIVLGSGVFFNNKLLNTLDVKDKTANLFSTPAFSFAFLTFSRNKNKNIFGMGNATFLSTNQDDDISTFGNFYDGDSLSDSRGLVFSNNFLIDKIFKLLSKHIIAGAGFLSSDNIEVKIKNNCIKHIYSKQYLENISHIKNNLMTFAKSNKLFLIKFNKTSAGADIHYAGGIPNTLFDKNMVQDGKLTNFKNIMIIGGSSFTYLPPESPTLSFIVNSFRIGKKL